MNKEQLKKGDFIEKGNLVAYVIDPDWKNSAKVSINGTKLLIPFKPKLTRFTNILPENNSNFNYIIKKTKKFSPASTMINHSSLLIPNQPKKTSFK